MDIQDLSAMLEIIDPLVRIKYPNATEAFIAKEIAMHKNLIIAKCIERVFCQHVMQHGLCRESEHKPRQTLILAQKPVYYSI